ncbi:hypothetical protein QBC35DRAFT_435577 [Podospora australis]|uniref:CBM1 domain-containing protein n=1 Tax=Podospora australis TaxID=1536484 RepID=A0AAN6WS77_9PEZI|nr:hypothetical protein QBC35DRAFT_435577 [Podospora australis]
MRSVTALPLLVAGATAQAVQSPYGQCGGQGWSGATACGSGWQCTTYNPYYAQCVPGATSAPAATSTRVASSTAAPSTPAGVTSSRTTLSTITTPAITVTPTSPGNGNASPTPTTLQSGWFWIRAVATPNYRSYLQPAPTGTPPVPAVLANSKSAAQFNIVSGQLVQNRFGNGGNLYLHVENPSDKTQRRLKTWFETTPNTYGTFGWQGDTLIWTTPDITRPNSAAWLVCGDGKELFVNTGAFLWDTPAGCFDHTIHSYGGSQADV